MDGDQAVNRCSRFVFLQRRGEISAILTLTICLVLIGICKSQPVGGTACIDTTISGEVLRGERFESTFADGLLFVLDPSIGAPNPDGWTIRVLSDESDHDYLMVATPPYRFSHPRYLDTSYGNTAEQAVAWDERPFNFVLSEQDFERMHEAIGVLLWSGDKSEEEIAAAREVTESVRKGSGTLRITSSETSPSSEEAPLGRIEKVAFEVELCF